ncbi:hypothetical protein BDW68DRAFT_3353 [Aspergillus falconensis]
MRANWQCQSASYTPYGVRSTAAKHAILPVQLQRHTHTPRIYSVHYTCFMRLSHSSATQNKADTCSPGATAILFPTLNVPWKPQWPGYSICMVLVARSSSLSEVCTEHVPSRMPTLENQGREFLGETTQQCELLRSITMLILLPRYTTLHCPYIAPEHRLQTYCPWQWQWQCISIKPLALSFTVTREVHIIPHLAPVFVTIIIARLKHCRRSCGSRPFN